jgi:hypothetical protein
MLPPFEPKANSRHPFLSGVEINQNQAPTDLGHYELPVTWTYQTFSLPNNFQRGTGVSPDLTGVQICAKINSSNYIINISIEKNIFGDWETLDSGSVSQVHTEGDYVWVTAYFNDPIPVLADDLQREYRIGVQSDFPVWYSTPAPQTNWSKNFGGVDEGQLLFRLLAHSADSGEDFLGNTYRSVVMRNGLGVVTTQANPAPNSFWLSKPNPSKFAVEALYFDISDIDKPNVVDRILIDPITPGVRFNIYHSSEGEPGVSEKDWEYKLWTPLKQNFIAQRRQEHALSEPITARYVKVEFTHLQPQFYQAGTFHQPLVYKKFPKWVLDYFTVEDSAVDEVSIGKNVKVIFDNLDLAFRPRVSDLVENPEVPQITTSGPKVSNTIEQQVIERINTSLHPYTQPPSTRVNSITNLLSTFVAATRDFAYPIEKIIRAKADVSQVSSLDRSALVVENQVPLMFFYLTCRHQYRELEATFEHDRAYFVGVRELALSREHYTEAFDSELYIENLSDFTNVMRNDFIPQD